MKVKLEQAQGRTTRRWPCVICGGMIETTWLLIFLYRDDDLKLGEVCLNCLKPGLEDLSNKLAARYLEVVQEQRVIGDLLELESSEGIVECPSFETYWTTFEQTKAGFQVA